MKKTIIILPIAFTIIGFGLWFALRHAPEKLSQQQVNFPAVSGVSSTTLEQQRSFLANPEVHSDQYNPGSYYIGNQPSDNYTTDDSPYLIRYFAKTNYFNIGINQEPIGSNRQKMETYLMQLLGATKDQMCSLNYAVYVANSVNSQYSGENLGFSFCPGAVKLPN